MQHDAIKELDDVLTQEKAALLGGQYDALGPLEQRKEQALNALSKSNTAKSVLARIHFRIGENQSLLAAAIKGVGAARGRLEDLKNVQNGLTVYDHSGTVEVMATRGGMIEKKA